MEFKMRSGRMESLKWATGSMLIVMIIVQFLPIGLTKKGKFVIVLAAFFLALVGLIAIPSFSLWKVITMLFLLIFFIAHLLNTRLGHVLFIVDNSFGNKLLNQDDSYIDYNKVNIGENIDQFSLSRKEVAASIEPFEEKEIVDAGLFYTQHETMHEVEKNEEPNEVVEDDISFLLNRSIETEEEKSNEETFSEMEYISDIESLLLEASREEQNIDELGGLSLKLKDVDELPVLSFDHVLFEENEQVEATNPLDELEEIPLLSFQDNALEEKEKVPVKL
jgi:hypothetical protein